jgi:hypothetical protein
MWSQYGRMREGLAREFPQAGRALSWTSARLPAQLFRREPVVWAAVSAVGAGFMVSVIAQVLVRLGFFLVEAFRVQTTVTLAWLPVLLGTAVAAAVALRAGGALSLALYLAYLAVEIVLQIPGAVTFCERAGPANSFAMCTPLGFVTTHWALWSGLGVGLLLSRSLAARGEGTNLTLRVAGTYAIAWSLALRVWSLSVIQADQAGALNASITFSVLALAAALAAGVVAARSEHRIRSASVVALFLVVPWLTSQVPLLISQLTMSAQSGVQSEFLPAIVVGALTQPIAAIVLVLAAAVTDRQRFIPRDSA